MPGWPHTLVARLLLWALVLVAVSVPLFWLFFSVAVERISVQVVDTRILELANQVRGYRASAEAFRARSENPVERPPRLVIGGADADWVWQISVNGQIIERSELLEIADTELPAQAAVSGPDFQIAEFDTALGVMRIAGRRSLGVSGVPTYTHSRYRWGRISSPRSLKWTASLDGRACPVRKMAAVIRTSSVEPNMMGRRNDDRCIASSPV